MATKNPIAQNPTHVQIPPELFAIAEWLNGCPSRKITITAERGGFEATMLEHGQAVHGSHAEDPVTALAVLDEVADELLGEEELDA
jgi:hypothetical protein